MFRKSFKKIYQVLVLVIIVGVLSGTTSTFASGFMGIPERSSRLNVNGSAVISVAPDTAYISLGVETSDPSAEIASAENAERMAKVLAALKGLGLTEREIATKGYNIYSYTQVLNRGTKEEVNVTTYQVQNKIEIVTKNLEQVGKIVDVAVKAGANQVQGITFDLADKQELQLKALENAIKQAKGKAEVMAAAAGIELGGLVSLNEDYASYAPTYDTMIMRSQALASAETSITPGDVEISAKVSLIFWF